MSVIKYSKSLLFILFGVIFSFCAAAQTATVRGNVYDKDTGEPIIYGNIVIKESTTGTNSDENGFYNINGIEPGTILLEATYLGYDTITVEVTVVAGEIKSQNFYLSENSINLGVVDISARRETARTEVKISKIEVSQKKIKALPSTGGEADILQYLQILPGIVSTGDQGGQLYIRGGSPVQNKILLDGLTIYNPFHSIGFFSVFETELIRNVDVLTGGFNAEHGGRLSAIVDINTREGNKTRFGGQLSASPFMAKARFEGPLKKFKEGKGSTSFVLSHKQSLIQNTSKSLYKYAADPDTLGLPFDFKDTYGKLSIVSANGSKFSFFGFNFDDVYNNPSIAEIGWSNVGGGANFTLIPTSSEMIINGLFGYTAYDIGIDENDNKPRSSDIDEIVAGLDFTIFGKNREFNYGLELKSIKTSFEFTNPFGQSLTQFQNTTELSGYFKFRSVIKEKLVLEPGFRAQYYASQAFTSLEPRIGLKYNLNDVLRFKAAAGMYSQNVLSTSNERDVVNLFSGFLSGPESEVFGLDGVPLETKVQLARHAVGGFEYDLTDRTQINIEGYYKEFGQLITVNRNKINNGDPDYVSETGDAYGVDFTVNYEATKWNLYANYSFGFVKRFDGEQEYPTVFDRRHNLNLLGTYNIDEKGDFQFSARYNLGSGFPFTKTQGFYNYNAFFEGVGTDILGGNPSEVGVIYSDERNGGRLPYYHRLDLSVTKFFRFSKNTNLEVVASATNAYNRDNIFFFDRIKFERVDQLPIIPSVALKFNF